MVVDMIISYFITLISKFAIRPCNIADLEFVDEQYHRSITWIIDNEITDDLAIPFSVSYDVFGEVRLYLFCDDV